MFIRKKTYCGILFLVCAFFNTVPVLYGMQKNNFEQKKETIQQVLNDLFEHKKERKELKQAWEKCFNFLEFNTVSRIAKAVKNEDIKKITEELKKLETLKTKKQINKKELLQEMTLLFKESSKIVFRDPSKFTCTCSFPWIVAIIIPLLVLLKKVIEEPSSYLVFNISIAGALLLQVIIFVKTFFGSCLKKSGRSLMISALLNSKCDELEAELSNYSM